MREGEGEGLPNSLANRRTYLGTVPKLQYTTLYQPTNFTTFTTHQLSKSPTHTHQLTNSPTIHSFKCSPLNRLLPIFLAPLRYHFMYMLYLLVVLPIFDDDCTVLRPLVTLPFPYPHNPRLITASHYLNSALTKYDIHWWYQ